jgi:hypothetical protein
MQARLEEWIDAGLGNVYYVGVCATTWYGIRKNRSFVKIAGNRA